MSIIDILDLEGEAISKTICEYTTNNFIRSYATKLSKIKYPEEKEKLTYIIGELTNWYKKEIDNIKNDKYVHNRESHIKSYGLLEEIKKDLD